MTLTSFETVFFLILFLFLSLISNTSCSNTRPETGGNGLKRTRVIGNDLASLAGAMQTMNIMTSSTSNELAEADRILLSCNAQIPFLTDRERTGMFDEAVFNQHFGLIKLFKNHGIINEMVDSDHLESLCRSESEVSTEILVFLIDNSQSARYLIVENLSSLLLMCVPLGFEKFQALWAGFHGTRLDVTALSVLISKIAVGNFTEFYDFVMESLSRHENCEAVLKMALTSSAHYSRVEAVYFLLENGRAPISVLSLDSKKRALLSAVNKNHSSLLRILLEDAELLATVQVMPSSPWKTAIKWDYPEVLEVFMTTLSDFIHTNELMLYAFNQKSVKVLNYLREKNMFTGQMYHAMAHDAITSNSVEALRMAVDNTGMNVKELNYDGVNLLTMAVYKNSLEIVEYLLKSCSVDPNAINEQLEAPNLRNFCTAIHIAQTPDMVRLLAENGADVNALYIKKNHNGDIVDSTTALHKAAAKNNLGLFKELIACGADITIPDHAGFTNEIFNILFEAN